MVKQNEEKFNLFALLCLSGTNTIPGGYMPSVYKKDSGSAGLRGRQGVSIETRASSERRTSPFTQNLLIYIFYLLYIYCCFRLCNLEVRSEPNEPLGQLANRQQEHIQSVASPAITDHSWAARLDCQIWTPLVACLQLRFVLWELCHFQRVGLVILQSVICK